MNKKDEKKKEEDNLKELKKETNKKNKVTFTENGKNYEKTYDDKGNSVKCVEVE